MGRTLSLAVVIASAAFAAVGAVGGDASACASLVDCQSCLSAAAPAPATGGCVFRLRNGDVGCVAEEEVKEGEGEGAEAEILLEVRTVELCK